VTRDSPEEDHTSRTVGGRAFRPARQRGHDSERAAMIYQHEARGADKATTDAIDRDPRPVWLWWSRTSACPADVDRLWQGVLAPFRPGTHLPAVQAGPRLDRPEDPRPGRR